MKKVFILLSLLLGCVSISAQNNKAIYVVVVDESNKEVDTSTHTIIVDLFQEALIADGYDVRLTRNKNVYSMQKDIELEYQERGAVSIDEAIEDGAEMVVGTYCMIQMRESSRYDGSKEYYFNAKIYDLRTGKLEKHASYPDVDLDEDKMINEIRSRSALQIVSLHLLKGLGFNIKEDKLTNAEANYFKTKTEVDKNTKKEEKKEERKERFSSFARDIKHGAEDLMESASDIYDKIFRPERNTFEMRILSGFDKRGAAGLGFFYSRSYLKIGFDAIMGKGSRLDQNDVDTSSDEYIQDEISADFTHINTVETVLDNGAVKTRDEYAASKLQFFVSPGIAFKYFSIECGLGLFLCKGLDIEYASYNYSQSSNTVTITPSKTYFALRPTVAGYIPTGEDGPRISISAGYNYVSAAPGLNGFILGIGLGW